jgi:altronate dehydratase large subunit
VPDLEYTKRVLVGLATHPNVGAVVLVSLGCESMPFDEIAQLTRAAGKPLRHLVVQQEGGVSVAVTRGVAWIEEFVRAQAGRRRELASLSELVVAIECGGSDAMSGLTANPAAGLSSDLVVAAGGTVLLSETPEFIGAERLLAARAVDESVASRILDIVGRREAEARSAGVDLRGTQPTPGNIAGGISTLEEKSLGAIRKAGTGAVREVVEYGMRPSQRGLVIMDTPGYDPSSISGMVAGGAHLVVFTTGRGSPVGAPVAPVIKVASNSEIARRFKEHIDIDAGTILGGEQSVASVGTRIFAQIVSIAGGRLTKAEECGHYELAIARLGPEL